MERLAGLLDRKDELKIVAVGEIGFDYYWEPIEKELQHEYFYKQMKLAERYGLPVVIHDREAHGDTVAMIERFPMVKGILHSCSASAETVRELCKKGWYISFSGTVTFKNAARVKDAAAAVPLDKILSETDCPYLAPHPHRGKLNHSGLMELTAKAIAEIHGISEEKMREYLYKNAINIFNLK
jgi:TatD DNase family protein